METTKEPGNFIKLLVWFKTMFEDNKGKVSIKRVIAFMLAQTTCFVIIYIALKNDLAVFDWASTCLFLGAMFTQISALIAASVIEKKHILTNTQVQTTTEQKP